MNEELLSLYIQNWDDVATTSLKALSDLLNANLAIHRVRELHYEEDGLCGYCLDLDESNGKWYRPKHPCQTIQALDGEQ
jgi:hypothetical protein